MIGQLFIAYGRTNLIAHYVWY